MPDAISRSPIAMPARGARGDLTPDEIRHVAAYVWAISQARGEPWTGGHASHVDRVPAGAATGTGGPGAAATARRHAGAAMMRRGAIRVAATLAALAGAAAAGCSPASGADAGHADAVSGAGPTARTDDVRASDAALRRAMADAGAWAANGRDYTNQRFSPLAQITAANVARLRVAWVYTHRRPARATRRRRWSSTARCTSRPR